MIRFPIVAWRSFDAETVQFGAFRYKYHEGHPELPPEPSYLNFRKPPKGPLTDALIDQLGMALHYVASLAQVEYGAVVGVPEAGDPLATVFAKIAGVPQLWLGKEEQGGQRRIIPGSLVQHMAQAGIRPGTNTLLIDDLIVRAHSKIEAVTVVRSEGLVVNNAAALVDREQGGREALAQAGVRLHAVWEFIELMFFYYRGGVISWKKYSEVIGHLRDQQKALGLTW